MRRKRINLPDKRGMALVVCMLIMAVMAMIGVGIATNSTVEIKIAGNQRTKAISFGNADAGTEGTPEIIEQNIEAGDWRSGQDGTWDAAGYIFLQTDYNGDGTNDLTIHVKDHGGGKIAFATITSEIDDAVTLSDGAAAEVTVAKDGNLAAGSAIQMAAGYEGIGKGAGSGGYHAYYLCRSRGTAGSNTATTTEYYYRHVSK
ncbi:MAG: pilus assembly PilX N-terminal domain-containing protein [Deltaproteobacteria bacterium]|nr:pilus assembly PilX N-terminal domain-containing protein [Candidatus Anaeroferrophillacea bacterium]